MKTIAILMAVIMTMSILAGIGIQNVSADNFKTNEPAWGKVYNQGASTDIFYNFRVQAGDNVTLNITSFTGSGGFAFGLAGGGGSCPGYYLVYSSSSNDTTADAGYINFPLITVPYSFWIVPGLEQAMCIHTVRFGSSSMTFTINKVNITPPQDPAIKVLQDQIKDLQRNMSNTQISIYYLTQKINALNTTLSNMNETQNQMLDNISRLWINLDKLKVSLDDLTVMVNGLNTSLNFTLNVTRLEQNLTQVNTDLSSIQDQLEVLSTDKGKIKDIQDQLNDTLVNITAINSSVALIKNTMPKSYDDTALKNRIAQLESENKALNDELKNTNKKQNQASSLRGDDFRVVILALTIGIVGILFGVFALVFAPLSKMPRGLEKEDLDETSKSKDYNELEEEPKEIPKAKAKKKKEEDLDDVMRKLKD